MEKLFMIYIGGKVPKGNIEVHDVQFVVAETFEDTFEVIRSRWFGIPESLHIDSYKILEGVDGHQIRINKSGTSEKKLFWIHIGGHVIGDMKEHHTTSLMLATDISEVRQRASERLFTGKELEHIDHIVAVEEACEMPLSLEYTGKEYSLEPTWFGFKKLNA